VWKSARLTAGALALCATLFGGCASIVPQATALREARPQGLPAQTELFTVPFFPQKDYQCGPAALATALASTEVAVTPDELVEQVYIPARKGSLQIEMLAAARRYGRVSYQLAPRFEAMLREVAAGTPVIVLQNYGAGPFPIWHYAVVAGYDFERRELMLRSGEKPRLVIPFSVFEYTWKDSDYWAMVAMPPDRIPVTADEQSWLAAVTAMERGGDAVAAREAYAAFLERWPDNSVAALGLANMQYAAGDLLGAAMTLRTAAQRHPESVAVLNNLAHVLSEAGDNREALAWIERARALGGPLAASVAETHAMILERSEAAKAPPVRERTERRRGRNRPAGPARAM